MLVRQSFSLKRAHPPSCAAPGEKDPGEQSPLGTHAAPGIYDVRQASGHRLTCAITSGRLRGDTVSYSLSRRKRPG